MGFRVLVIFVLCGGHAGCKRVPARQAQVVITIDEAHDMTGNPKLAVGSFTRAVYETSYFVDPANAMVLQTTDHAINDASQWPLLVKVESPPRPDEAEYLSWMAEWTAPGDLALDATTLKPKDHDTVFPGLSWSDIYNIKVGYRNETWDSFEVVWWTRVEVAKRETRIPSSP